LPTRPSWNRRGAPTPAVRPRRPQRTAGSYRTTPRYQIQVRELAADAAFDDLLALNVVAVANAGGTLRAAASDML